MTTLPQVEVGARREGILHSKLATSDDIPGPFGTTAFKKKKF